jgi:hypothetical protein
VGSTKNVSIVAGNNRNVFIGGQVASTLTDNGTNNAFYNMQAVTFNPNAATAVWSRVYNNSGVYYADHATVPVTVAALPICNATMQGALSFVVDATAAFNGTNAGSIVAGGSSNRTPVYCDSVNWRLGENDNIPEYLRRKVG